MPNRRKEKKQPAFAPWMSSYSDIVTMLLCFFVMLFAMSSVDAAKYQAAFSYFADNIKLLPADQPEGNDQIISDGVSQISTLESLFSKKQAGNVSVKEVTSGAISVTGSALSDASLEEARTMATAIAEQLTSLNIKDEVTIDYNAHVIRLQIAGEMLFDSGKAEIRTGSYPIIDALGKIISDSKFGEKTIQIEGHTDNVPMSSVQYPSNWELSNARASAVGKYLITAFTLDPTRVISAGYGEYRPIASNDTPEGRAKNRRVEIKLIGKEVTLSDEYIKIEK